MRKTIKSLFSRVLIPLSKWYLRKERTYRKNGIHVIVLPGVFHPGLFSSTNFLWKFLSKQNVEDNSLLELGCGSGFLSVSAAKAGAQVTASDISRTAIRNTKINASKNNVEINIVESDLFDKISPKKFDWVMINPPYYAGAPNNEEELAWYCGKNFEYFQKLFKQLNNYIHEESMVIMVLTLGCDLDRIFSIARTFGFELEFLEEKSVLFDEKDFLYRIRIVNSVATTPV
jgi:release factor glutamine methyltransferase